MKTLYIYLSTNNINSVMAIDYYKPTHLVIIRDSQLHTPEDSSSFIHYLEKQGYNVSALGINFNQKNPLQTLGTKMQQEDMILLPNVDTTHGYQLFYIGMQYNIPMAQVEKDGDLYEYKDTCFEFVTDQSEVNIDDFITSRGGRIESSSKIPFELPETNRLLTLLEKNLVAYKYCFRYNFTKFVTIRDNDRVLFNLNYIEEKHHAFVYELLDFFLSEKVASYHQKGNKIVVFFSDLMIKNYLFKTGTWLEHVLYNLFKELGVDDLDSSLTFLWDSNIRKLKNEVDLIAISNNELYVISCKDTSHIEPEQLNEIYVNTTHLGYEASHPMIFTTSHLTDGIIAKAKEFGIPLISYHKDHNRILHQLSELINTNTNTNTNTIKS